MTGTPAPLTRTPADTVHALRPGELRPVCSAPANGSHVTADPSRVTCTDCAPDTWTRRTVLAAELRPGDVVLTADGSVRAYAAFDTDTDGHTVTVWTAIPDQRDGVAPILTLPADRLLTVMRRDGGPRVTRVAVTVPTSAAPDDARWSRDLDTLGWHDATVHCHHCGGELVRDYDGRGTGWSHWSPTPGTYRCGPGTGPDA